MPALSKELTELVALNPKRADQVKTPATGFPVLIMKSAAKDVNAQGGIDETPDIDGAEHVLQLLARLIGSESREMAAGHWDEICDIQLLTEAAHLVKCFKHREVYTAQLEGGDDGEPILKSVEPDAFPSEDELSSVATYVLKRKISAAERKRLASEGKALPDGSYPIENAEDLHNAAILARSGHGDVAAAKRLIAKRAKELGVPNPLADSASKDTPVTDPVPTPPPAKSVEERLEDFAKAMRERDETIEGLRTELAAIKAAPQPGGPFVTAPVSKSSASDDAQAERFERLSKSVQDRELARYYAERARELKAPR